MNRLRTLIHRVDLATGRRSAAPDDDPAARVTYQHERLKSCRKGVQALCLITGTLLVASAIATYVSDPGNFRVLLQIRLTGLLALAIVFWLVRTPYGQLHACELGLLAVATIGITLQSLAAFTDGYASHQYDRLHFLIMGAPLLISWSPRWSVVACAILVPGYILIGVVTGHTSDADFLRHLALMTVSSMIGIGSTVVAERLRWNDFLGRRLLLEMRREANERERRYRSLVETAGSAIIVLSPEYQILEFNRTAESIYGVPRKDAIGKNYLELFLPNNVQTRDTIARDINKVRAEASAGKFENSVRGRDGVKRVLLWSVTRLDDDDGRPVGILATGQDITERKRAEQRVRELNEHLEERVATRTSQLRESEEKWRSLVENAPSSIMTLGRDGRVMFISRSLWPEDLTGKILFDYLSPSHRQMLHAALDSVFDDNEATSYEIGGLGPDGIAAWYSNRVAPIRRDGRVEMAILVATDITKHKEAEERARQRQAELAHVLRVSTVSEMAAGLAHELNQPLTAITGYTGACIEQLRSGEARTDSLVKLLEDAGDEAQRAGTIIHHLHDLVRPGPSERTPSDLTELVSGLRPFVEAEIERSPITVEFDLIPEVLPVRVNRVQVEQIIMNLVRNAVEALGDGQRGGELRIRTSHSGNGTVEVAISDTGVGISDEIKDRLFDAFFTTKPGGLGMGLAISYSIAEAHGGDLSLTPNPDRGVTARITLPLRRD